MANLTKEIFEKGLRSVLKEQSKELKAYTDQRLGEQSKELKAYTDQRLGEQSKELKVYTGQRLSEQSKELKIYTDEKIDELARIVNSGFSDLTKRLDVVERVERLENQMAKITQALHVRL